MTLSERYSALKMQVIDLRSRESTTRESLNNNELTLSTLTDKLSKLNTSKTSLVSAIEVMKQLIDVLSREQINQLKDLISYGLKTIFTDRDYSIDIVISESRNVKQASFVLIEKLADGSVIRSDFKDSIGGGILAVVGLIIQVYYECYYHQYPILFMDEALSQISTQYLPNVLAFIDQLAEKRHFHFVLITHDDRLIEYSNHVYQVVNGVVSLRK